ncbi:hypothetical protein ABZW11_17330 [Nonomuraea sp. NPDC004580]
MTRRELEQAALAAEQAAATFTARGQHDEAAVSALMAARYRNQLNDRKD